MYLEEYTNYSISYGKTEKIGNAKNNDNARRFYECLLLKRNGIVLEIQGIQNFETVWRRLIQKHCSSITFYHFQAKFPIT